MSRLTICAVLLAGLALTAVRATEAPAPAVVHEWGTFTSIAGPDGRAVEWTPQAGPSDLPCFVVRNRFNIKGALRGTVRMETPVMYFYAPDQTQASVSVRFNEGVITEWYPPAAVTEAPAHNGRQDGTIHWPLVSIVPQLSTDFRTESAPSHYYHARATDASPISVGDDSERFLFYRGVGTFAPPIAAIAAGDGSVDVASTHSLPLGDILFFENRGGSIALDVRHIDASRIMLTPPAPLDGVAPPLSEIEQILVANGLYEREARAMVETWRDSWFEEGARLIYVTPASFVDSVLPLDVRPRPASVARVFVGRIELVTPSTLRAVQDAIDAGDRFTLERYSRFLEPIVNRIRATTPAADRAELERLIRSVGGLPWASDPCPSG
jgi:hypothetical protein